MDNFSIVVFSWIKLFFKNDPIIKLEVSSNEFKNYIFSTKSAQNIVEIMTKLMEEEFIFSSLSYQNKSQTENKNLATNTSDLMYLKKILINFFADRHGLCSEKLVNNIFMKDFVKSFADINMLNLYYLFFSICIFSIIQKAFLFKDYYDFLQTIRDSSKDSILTDSIELIYETFNFLNDSYYLFLSLKIVYKVFNDLDFINLENLESLNNQNKLRNISYNSYGKSELKIKLSLFKSNSIFNENENDVEICKEISSNKNNNLINEYFDYTNTQECNNMPNGNDLNNENSILKNEKRSVYFNVSKYSRNSRNKTNYKNNDSTIFKDEYLNQSKRILNFSNHIEDKENVNSKYNNYAASLNESNINEIDFCDSDKNYILENDYKERYFRLLSKSFKDVFQSKKEYKAVLNNLERKIVELESTNTIIKKEKSEALEKYYNLREKNLVLEESMTNLKSRYLNSIGNTTLKHSLSNSSRNKNTLLRVDKDKSNIISKNEKNLSIDLSNITLSNTIMDECELDGIARKRETEKVTINNINNNKSVHYSFTPKNQNKSNKSIFNNVLSRNNVSEYVNKEYDNDNIQMSSFTKFVNKSEIYLFEDNEKNQNNGGNYINSKNNFLTKTIGTNSLCYNNANMADLNIKRKSQSLKKQTNIINDIVNNEKTIDADNFFKNKFKVEEKVDLIDEYYTLTPKSKPNEITMKSSSNIIINENNDNNKKVKPHENYYLDNILENHFSNFNLNQNNNEKEKVIKKDDENCFKSIKNSSVNNIKMNYKINTIHNQELNKKLIFDIENTKFESDILTANHTQFEILNRNQQENFNKNGGKQLFDCKEISFEIQSLFYRMNFSESKNNSSEFKLTKEKNEFEYTNSYSMLLGNKIIIFITIIVVILIFKLLVM